MDILLICTANQCRSPMAEGLLNHHLTRSGVSAAVGSAGLLPGGSPATGDSIAVMAARGIDIGAHRSRTIDAATARRTPLVIGMTRQHVREAVVTYGAAIEHTFTLKELVRRGEKVGRRPHDQTVVQWLGRVGAGRQVSDLMGDDPDDDVADPVGRPREVYEGTAAELDDLIARLVKLLVGHSPDDPPPSGAYGGGSGAYGRSGRAGLRSRGY